MRNMRIASQENLVVMVKDMIHLKKDVIIGNL